MQILLYSTNNEQAEEFKSMISSRLSIVDIMFCNTFDSLFNSLKCTYMYFAVVLMVASEDELHDLLSIQRSFDNTRTLLVLPDDSPGIKRDALKLYPRYMTEKGGNFTTIFEVLKMMYLSSDSSFAISSPNNGEIWRIQ